MLADPSCRRCALWEDVNTVCVPGDGPLDAEILIVGEAPGAVEDDQGIPFAGDAGRELNALLPMAGLSRERVRVTNAARCRPPNNRNPKQSELNACRMFTVREIVEVRPKVIVALGGIALRALTGQKVIGRNRGKLLPLLPEYRSDTPVIATYHPAAALHNPSQRGPIYDDIVADLKTARRHCGGASGPDYMALAGGFDVDQTLAAFKALAGAQRLACDLEWEVLPDSGSWPWSKRNGKLPRLVSIGLAANIEGKYISVAVSADGDWAQYARKLIDSKPTVYHLGIETSDLIWLLAKGFHPIVEGDTYTLARLLNVSASDFGLKTLAPMLTDFPAGWDSGLRAKRKGKKRSGYDDGLVGRVPATEQEWRLLLEYNAKDCVATLMLYERLREIAVEQGRDQVLAFHDRVLSQLLTVFSEMAINGIPADAELVTRAEVEGRKRLRQSQIEVATILGYADRPDLIATKNQVAGLIERNLGIPLPRTPSGQPELNKQTRQDYRKRHPIFAALDTQSLVVKRHGTYYAPWKKLLELQGDDRLHFIYRPTGAITGRTSSTSEMGASLQQLMRGRMVHNIVKAPPGKAVVAGDLSQIELRCVADVSQDERLLKYYREGKDVHRMTGAAIKALGSGLNIAEFLEQEQMWADAVTPFERQAAKVPNFGLAYGGKEDVVINVGIQDYDIEFSRAEASLFVSAYFALYPGIGRWHEANNALVDAGGVYTKFGRWRSLNLNEERDELLRKAANTPIQSMANDIMFCGVLRFEEMLHEVGLKSAVEIFGYVHDSLLVLCAEDIAHEVGRIMHTTLTNPQLDRVGVEFSVPIDAEIKIGAAWGDAEEVSFLA